MKISEAIGVLVDHQEDVVETINMCGIQGIKTQELNQRDQALSLAIEALKEIDRQEKCYPQNLNKKYIILQLDMVKLRLEQLGIEGFTKAFDVVMQVMGGEEKDGK